jgi:hypothetical protein
MNDDLRLRAYELLIANIDDRLQQAHRKRSIENAENQQIIKILAKAIYSFKGYSFLMEVAKLCDDANKKDHADMVDYVESNFENHDDK